MERKSIRLQFEVGQRQVDKQHLALAQGMHARDEAMLRGAR